MWLSGLAAIIGLVIIASPWVFADVTDTGTWHNVALGALVFILAGYSFYQTMNDRPVNVAVMALVALLGLWAIISPFALDLGPDELMWAHVAAGLLLFLFGGYVSYMGRGRRPGVARPADADD